MKNKILGTILTLIAITGIITGLLLIPQLDEYGWTILITSSFMVLIGVVVFRKGVSGVVRAYYDGTPRVLR